MTGGLTPKNMRFIEGQDSPFLKAYHDKGRVNQVLEHVPLFAVLVEDLGVRGALKSAQIEYQKYYFGGSTTTSETKQQDSDQSWLPLAAATVAGIAIGMMTKRRGSRFH